MRFGGWIGAMTGLSCLSTNGGLAYMDRWPPLTLPIELHGAPEEDDDQRENEQTIRQNLLNS